MFWLICIGSFGVLGFLMMGAGYHIGFTRGYHDAMVSMEKLKKDWLDV